MLHYIYHSILFSLFISCKGQIDTIEKTTLSNPQCSLDFIERRILDLPEIKEKNHLIDSLTNHQRGISMQSEEKDSIYEIRVGFNGELRWENYYTFQVKKEDCSLKVLNVESGNYESIKEWRGNENDSHVNINGVWRLECENDLTILDVVKEVEGSMSLYSFNRIYIKVRIKKIAGHNYHIMYKNIDFQEIYYEDKNSIVEGEISKEHPIAEIEILDKGKIKLNWIGLFNTKINMNL